MFGRCSKKFRKQVSRGRTSYSSNLSNEFESSWDTWQSKQTKKPLKVSEFCQTFLFLPLLLASLLMFLISHFKQPFTRENVLLFSGSKIHTSRKNSSKINRLTQLNTNSTEMQRVYLLLTTKYKGIWFLFCFSYGYEAFFQALFCSR